jgi:hypothetical protein
MRAARAPLPPAKRLLSQGRDRTRKASVAVQAPEAFFFPGHDMSLAEIEAPGPPRANGATAPPVLPPGDGLETPPGTPPISPTRAVSCRRHPPETVERVRQQVEQTTKPFYVIASETGVSKTTVSVWTRKFGWRRQPGARAVGGASSSNAAMVAGLRRTFMRHLAVLEQRAKSGNGEEIEKDARTLGVLAKTLETLIELDRDGAKVGEPERVDRDLEAIDADLARRIDAWANGGEGS